MSILHLLVQTCDLYAPVAATYGLPSYSGTATASGVKCRGEKEHTVMQRADGTTFTTDLLLFLDSSATVAENYKVVFSSVSYKVEKVDPITDAAGDVTHYELMCTELRES